MSATAAAGERVTQASSISVAGVSKVFRRGKLTITALQDANLEIGAGQFVSLLGPSGCGKSTLLKAIAGLQPPSSGAVRVDGRPVTAPLTDAGVAFQKPTLLPWRTVTENISLPFHVSGSISREEGARRVERLLEITGLQDFAHHYPRELSGGMEQRVAIARSLVLSPGLLLMDEPFGALDEFTREDLNEELLRIWSAEPKTVVFVTHSISEAVFLSDRIAVMSARPGRIFDVFDVDLPRPRTSATRTAPEFNEIVAHTRRVLDQTH
ncbi:ABC transporter ATP-binding protein [Pseudonocardia kunmingensis]|uniref:NitT/TauT family transport system ATP-binding protein n=1 Tax=Pseudonocardia kunmingensis TaxID=630975 RepID=A0A543DQG1_9PSEU|nr:ABC transporter ATP-binding protein [Pseudonocardia kunmingensis]TQM11571.1 NitT/TauT family transport system ATP-binding protein [Pseudonocardia kunmingensis]